MITTAPSTFAPHAASDRSTTPGHLVARAGALLASALLTTILTSGQVGLAHQYRDQHRVQADAPLGAPAPGTSAKG